MNKLCSILTINELAKELGIHENYLNYYLNLNDISLAYNKFIVKKKDGSDREIWAPEESLKIIQRKLNKVLYEDYINLVNNEIAQAFIRDKSIITNSVTHTNKKTIICIDLKDFFGTINFGRIYGYFIKNFNFLLQKQVAFAISKIACCKNKLPQGSPLSPTISNMIAQILDYHISSIAKKYKCKFTRYADDMTFSTNDQKIRQNLPEFLLEVYKAIYSTGFIPNTKKTRVLYSNSCQKVTGLVTNKKLGVLHTYHKKTRAMCNNYFKYGNITINNNKFENEQAKNILLGKLSFINQIDRFNKIQTIKREEIHNKDFNRISFYNSMKQKEQHINLNSQEKLYFEFLKNGHKNTNSREKLYRDFLFYINFYNNAKTTIVTEGKTDILYIDSAIRKSIENPSEFRREKGYQFDYKSFRCSKTFESLTGIHNDGGDKMQLLYNFFTSKNERITKNCAIADYNIAERFNDRHYMKSKFPIIFILDNEKSKDKPLNKFLNHIKLSPNDKKELEDKFMIKLNTKYKDVYLVIIPKNKSDKDDYEIEDLFDEETLQTKIGTKHFNRNENDHETSYGKQIFATRIIKMNYRIIDFSKFIPLLDLLEKIITQHTN